MAKLPPSCKYADEVRLLVSEGRQEDAIDFVMAQLRAGISTPLFLDAVESLLRPPPKGVGRPRRIPRKAFEIGEDMEGLIANGATYEQAVLTLKEKYGKAERTIERAVKYYREIRAASQAEADEAYRQ